MDWDLKMPPWDLAELELNAEPNIGSMIGPSHALDCSVDLKLGGLGDLGSSQKWKNLQRISPSSSSKRARQTGNSSQNAACLVDGCKSDLSNCREYHKRHKVCEAHSKTPVVLVGGQEQRFCQQCSRFHMLAEFDEVKRSCRKRLDGHNRRRRKPQPDSMNSGSLFTNHQGNRFSSYPQIFATATSHTRWPVVIKTEDPLFSHHPPQHFHNFPASSSRSFKESTRHFLFLQDSEPAICQPLIKPPSSVESSSSKNSHKIFSIDSDCALSLLSSPPQRAAIDAGRIVSSTDGGIPMGQPLISYGGRLGPGRFSSLHHGFSCSGMEDENVGSGGVLVSDASDHEMNCHGLFGVGGEGSSDEASQALPFPW